MKKKPPQSVSETRQNKEHLSTTTQNLARPMVSDISDGSHPKRLGTFDIVGILGSGGTSIVYEGINSRLGITRAIKLLKPHTSKQLSQWFDSEMSVSAQLKHPHIVEVYSFGEWNGLPYIEMEKLDGIGLDSLLKKKAALPLPVVTAVAILICRALKYAHNHARGLNPGFGDSQFHGIIHGDIKPSNIVLLNSGVVKIIDFGVAKPLWGLDKKFKDDGYMRGTIQYAAPEHLEGKQTDGRVDIYSFGVVLYEMVTGRNAFPGRNLAEILAKRKRNAFKPIGLLRPQAPKSLCELIERCMEPDLALRVNNTNDLLQELEKIHTQQMTMSDPIRVIKNYFEKDGAVFFASLRPSARHRTTRNRLKIILVAQLIVTLGFIAWISGLLNFINSGIISFFRDSSDRQISVVQQSAQTNNAPVITHEVVSGTTNSRRQNNSIPEEMTGLVETPVTAEDKEMDEESDNHAVFNGAYLKKKPSPVTSDGKKNQEVFMASIENPDKHNAAATSGITETDDAFLERLRIAVKDKSLEESDRLLSSRQVEDGEYYLFKAQHELNRNEEKLVPELMQKAQAVSSRNLDSEKFGIEVLYTRARYLSLVFTNNRNSLNANAAMEAWYGVKFQFRKTQEHAYYKEANSEIRRISSAMNTIK
jgi:serine/threonine protein kinase